MDVPSNSEACPAGAPPRAWPTTLRVEQLNPQDGDVHPVGIGCFGCEPRAKGCGGSAAAAPAVTLVQWELEAFSQLPDLVESPTFECLGQQVGRRSLEPPPAGQLARTQPLHELVPGTAERQPAGPDLRSTARAVAAAGAAARLRPARPQPGSIPGGQRGQRTNALQRLAPAAGLCTGGCRPVARRHGYAGQPPFLLRS